MTFNPDADLSGHRTRRRGRGRTTAIAGAGGVGVLGIIALIAGPILGVDLSGIVSALGGAGSTSESQAGALLTECDSGADANADVDCRMAGAQVALDAYWAEQVANYRAPQLTIVDGQTPTPCGTASNAVGPFYCPADAGVYLDATFFSVMQQQYGASAGSLAQLYIVGHEWGHHIQSLVGTMSAHPDNGTGPASNGVRMELQADCYAGAWIGGMTEQTDAQGERYLEPPTQAQLEDALNAALAVGDDHIQEMQGFVNPESFTHGSSAQRQHWLLAGYADGTDACDTFAASEAQLLE